MKVLPRFPPTSFAIPFGLAGLASVWRQMADFYGTPGAVSDVLFIAAAVCWLLLAVAAAGRMVREPRAILGGGQFADAPQVGEHRKSQRVRIESAVALRIE